MQSRIKRAQKAPNWRTTKKRMDTQYYHRVKADTSQLITEIKVFGRAKNERDEKKKKLDAEIEAKQKLMDDLRAKIKSATMAIPGLERMKQQPNLREHAIKKINDWEAEKKRDQEELDGLEKQLSAHKEEVKGILEENKKVPTFYGPMSWSPSRSVGEKFSDGVGTVWQMEPADVTRMLEVKEYRDNVGYVPVKWLQPVTAFEAEQEAIWYNAPAVLVSKYWDFQKGVGVPREGEVKGKAHITWEKMGSPSSAK